jgi:cell division protein FtsI/penicillin-binding protein 2
MFGTARRASNIDSIAGKTGTCTDGNTHLGWFGSFNYTGDNRLVVVVMLTGGRGISGGTAAGVAGEVYRRLGGDNYLAARPAAMPESVAWSAAGGN